MPNKELIDKIEEKRQEMGMSKNVFAMFLGVSRQTFYNWVTGKYPSATILRFISIKFPDLRYLPDKEEIIENDQDTRL